MFEKRKDAPRLCAAGHPQEESWEQCPYCEAGKAPLERPADNGAVAPTEVVEVVPKNKGAQKRPLVGWLVVLTGDQQGEDFHVRDGRNVIGKGSKASILVKDAKMSEKHALLEFNDDGYSLTDLESKRGTSINGRPVDGTAKLRDGDRIQIGATELKFRSFEA